MDVESLPDFSVDESPDFENTALTPCDLEPPTATEQATSSLITSAKESEMFNLASRQLSCSLITSALVRPISASKERMLSITCAALTQKLNGVRALLVSSEKRKEAYTGGTIKVLTDGEFNPDTDPISLFDCEYHSDDIFYAFDILIFDNKDVRHRSLSERIILVPQRLPAFAIMKPYKIASSMEDAKVCGKILLDEKREDFDGIIILNYTDPYYIPPLKWKNNLTCDFLIESTHSGNGYVLMSEGRTSHAKTDYASNSFRLRKTITKHTYPKTFLEVLKDNEGKVIIIHLTKHARTKLDLPENINRKDKIIVECKRNLKGSWIVLNLRPDRKRPNSTYVVQQNINLLEDKACTSSWLLRNLPLQNEFHIFHRFLESCYRITLLQHLEYTDIILEIGSKTARHLQNKDFEYLTMIETNTKKHDSKLLSHYKISKKIKYTNEPFNGNIPCTRLVSFFQINDIFQSEAIMRNFCGKVAQTNAQVFCGLIWKSEGGDISSQGRYSLTVETHEIQQQVFKFGQKMGIQISATEVHETFAPSLEKLKECMVDHAYIFKYHEELPAPLPQNGCPPSYLPLASRIQQISFIKS